MARKKIKKNSNNNIKGLNEENEEIDRTGKSK